MTATLEDTRIDEVSKLLQGMQAQIAALEAKIAALEASGEPSAPVAAAPVAVAPAPAPVREEITEEVMLVIAAAVAAYLGERAHIRVVRLIPTGAWAQQGRVSIQASHQLN